MVNIIEGVQQTVRTANFVKDQTSTLDKVCKIGKHSGEATVTACGLAGKTTGNTLTAVSNLTKAFTGFSVIAGALNIINRAFEFLVPGKKNVNKSNDFAWKSWKKNKTEDVKYEWMKSTWSPNGSPLSKSEKKAYIAKLRRNTFQDDGYWSGMKTTAQLGLTVAHTISFVEFFHRIGVYSLGAAAPIISMVKNAIYIPSAFLGVVDSSYRINRAGKYVSNCEAKKIKWLNKAGCHRDTIKTSCKAKVELIQNKITALQERMDRPNISESENRDIQSYINKQNLKIRRLEVYIQEAKTSSSDTLDEDSQWAKDCAFKVDAWAKNVFLAKKNAKVEKTKNALNIVYNIGKVALGIIGLVGLVTGIAFNPIALLVISIAWAAVETIGLSKEIYSFSSSSVYIQKPQLPPLSSLTVTAS